MNENLNNPIPDPDWEDFLDYPIPPDPDWDYTPLWRKLWKFRCNFDRLLKNLADIEEGTDLSDREIATKLTEAISSLQSAYKFLLEPLE